MNINTFNQVPASRANILLQSETGQALAFMAAESYSLSRMVPSSGHFLHRPLAWSGT